MQQAEIKVALSQEFSSKDDTDLWELVMACEQVWALVVQVGLVHHIIVSVSAKATVRVDIREPIDTIIHLERQFSVLVCNNELVYLP